MRLESSLGRESGAAGPDALIEQSLAFEPAHSVEFPHYGNAISPHVIEYAFP